MRTAVARLEKGPVSGGFVAGLVTAVCCGGLPLFASIGLGAAFAGLRLWRFVPVFVVLGTAAIVAVNWLYYRREVSGGHGSDAQLRRAMFVSAGLGLAFMVGAIFFFDWLEQVRHQAVERFVEGANEESPGAIRRGLIFALASFPVGLVVLGALPFPHGAGLSGQGRQRVRKGLELMDVASIKQEVKRRYGAFAEGGGHRESCCASQPEPQDEPASAPGFAMDQGLYSEDELSLVPDVALDLSRGCGNPTSFADLAPGEVVVDFGCGGGIDVILAAHKVGPEGRVVGRDLTPPMIERARQAVAKAGLEETVDLEVADMTDTGLPDASADVVISNCVINLVPDKDAVYREAARILRPGGRLAISDIVLSEPIAPDLADRFQAEWTGCMGGALPEADYLELVRQAGFADPEIVSRHVLSPEELEAMARCPGEAFTTAPAQEDLAAVTGKVASIKFRALKPSGV